MRTLVQWDFISFPKLEQYKHKITNVRIHELIRSKLSISKVAFLFPSNLNNINLFNF